MKKNLWILLFLTFPGFGLIAGGNAEVEDPLPVKGNPGVDLSAAVITSISPVYVLPGTLVALEGSKFGTLPGAVKVGDKVLTSFLSWEDTCIFFRIPKEGLPGPVEVQVGNAYSEDQLKPAPEGSIRFKWSINLTGLNAVVLKDWKAYNDKFAKSIDTPAVFTPPFYIRGQWIKSGDQFGNASLENWDNNSKRRMCVDKTGKVWYCEVVLTPANLESFGRKILKFAFEDGNTTDRNFSPLESDYALILKLDWAKNHEFPNVTTDPAVLPSDKDLYFDEKTRTINLSYPVRK